MREKSYISKRGYFMKFFKTFTTLASALILSANLLAQDILMGTTTSLDDTGFLTEVAKEFKEESGIDLKWIAKGTGEAMELGKRGDVDLLFVHDPGREQQFIKDGHGKARYSFMYNYFVLVTSKDFNLKGFPKDVNEVMKKIAHDNIIFISRGDKSGTHSKEKDLWKAAGIEPKFKNYKESGSGMAKTLNMTSELNGITLSDNGTFYSVEKNFELKEIPLNPSEVLRNTYSIVELKDTTPEKQKAIDELVKFLGSPKGQQIIESFGKSKFGQPLFKLEKK